MKNQLTFQTTSLHHVGVYDVNEISVINLQHRIRVFFVVHEAGRIDATDACNFRSRLFHQFSRMTGQVGAQAEADEVNVLLIDVVGFLRCLLKW